MISRSEPNGDQFASTVYFNSEDFAVRTRAELPKLLRNLSGTSDVARLAKVRSVRGTMTIGLGLPGDRSVALYLSSDGRPFHARDLSSPAEEDSVYFELDGTNNEFDSSCVITLEQALTAATEFVEAGELTEHLHWQAEGMSSKS